ncbi:MAG: hypothetical protein OXF07_01880 [Rhodobacter sp.]|nr:hypothetical protein [Rhodobacter sp.]
MPEGHVVGVAAVPNLDRFGRPVQNRSGADLVLDPIPGTQNAERVVTQTGLVVLPDGGKTFVEARERMIGLGLDQFAEPL